MVVQSVVDGNTNSLSVQLPVSATVGDFVEVCVSSTSNSFGYVWYGATVADSSNSLFEQVDAGKCRSYRFISGGRWNRYS